MCTQIACPLSPIENIPVFLGVSCSLHDSYTSNWSWQPLRIFANKQVLNQGYCTHCQLLYRVSQNCSQSLHFVLFGKYTLYVCKCWSECTPMRRMLISRCTWMRYYATMISFTLQLQLVRLFCFVAHTRSLALPTAAAAVPTFQSWQLARRHRKGSLIPE